MGEFESVDTTPSLTHVSFRDRKTAERFYYTLHGKEIPGVEGKVELAWVSALPAKKDEGGTQQGDAMAGMDEEEGEVREDVDERAVNMDYEVGDYGWE